MNFRRLVGPVLLAMRTAAWLSMKRGVASCGIMDMSWRIRRIQVVCCAAEVTAMYSASQVDSAVMVCFMQHMGVPLYM